PLDRVGGAGEVVHRTHRSGPVHRFDDGGRLAGLGGQQVGEVVLAVLEQLHGGLDHAGAFGGRRGRPRAGVERRTGGGRGGAYVGGGSQGHAADVLAGGGGVPLDALVAWRVGPLPANEQLVPFGLVLVGHTSPSIALLSVMAWSRVLKALVRNG